VSHRFGGEGQ
jgi:hypothetical protein